tara:strand:- start:230 stop:1075 length:846 start_codon:yes stop_codon:yes gene_type:complete
LSITVVFSAVAGYFLGTDVFLIEELLYLIFGGLLVTGSANGFNQILERDYDKIMTRTAQRPLPLKNLTLSEAVFFSIIIGFIGLYLLNFIKPEGSYFGYLSKSSLFGLISILLYVFSYTPLKRISTISIFVGAIPGAIPFLLGWVAATDNFGLIAGTLFAIQFFWQFPHFISIAWVQDEQYKKAGFKMLFGGKKSIYPALISVITSLVMMIISIIPFFWKQIDLQLSFKAFVIILIIGLWFTYKSVVLFKKLDDESARKLMLASFLYLPIMQVIYIIDKYI